MIRYKYRKTNLVKLHNLVKLEINGIFKNLYENYTYKLQR